MPYRFVVHSDCLIYFSTTSANIYAEPVAKNSADRIGKLFSDFAMTDLKRKSAAQWIRTATFRTHFDILKADLLPKQHSLLESDHALHNVLRDKT